MFVPTANLESQNHTDLIQDWTLRNKGRCRVVRANQRNIEGWKNDSEEEFNGREVESEQIEIIGGFEALHSV